MLSWIYPLLMCGVLLMIGGLLLMVGVMPPVSWKVMGLSFGMMSLFYLRTPLRNWRLEKRLHRMSDELTEDAEKLTPLLFGEYSPYVIETAEKLAEQRDATAVPALLIALQRCVDHQRPGWRDVAEALVDALAKIGDRRALEQLYSLENVRGIGIIHSIRKAIAAIEPQTSLLRAGSVDGLLTDTLLRPAAGSLDPMHDPDLLLRASTD